MNGIPISSANNFDNISASVDSYILRQVHNNPPLYTGLTLELFKAGHLKLILPFNIYNNHSLNSEYESLIHYDSFISNEHEDLRIIDLMESIFGFQIILEQYKRLLKEFNCNYELNIKYKFKNFNSLTPFIDSEEYMVFISENGLPINLKTSIDIPINGYIVNQFKDFNVASLSLNIISATSLSMHLVHEISEGYDSYLRHNSKNKQ